MVADALGICTVNLHCTCRISPSHIYGIELHCRFADVLDHLILMTIGRCFCPISIVSNNYQKFQSPTLSLLSLSLSLKVALEFVCSVQLLLMAYRFPWIQKVFASGCSASGSSKTSCQSTPNVLGLCLEALDCLLECLQGLCTADSPLLNDLLWQAWFLVCNTLPWESSNPITSRLQVAALHLLA